MHDIKDHQAVGFSEIHSHSLFELLYVPAVVLDVKSATEGIVLKQFFRIFAGALDTKMLAC